MYDFQFHRWYPLFKPFTARSIVVELTEEFVRYLEADGVQYPRDEDQPYLRPLDSDYDEDDDNDDASIAASSASTSTSLSASTSLSSTTTATTTADAAVPATIYSTLISVDNAIKELGGKVFPKLNWSSPRDAHWMLGTLECRQSSDVLLLLKSSDFIVHDLNAYRSGASAGDPMYLVLRQWLGRERLNPATEFRCFVRNGRLMAICQRDHLNYYDYLQASRSAITESIQCFWQKTIASKFPANEYVFDVICHLGGKDVELVDFNPFDPEVTDPLLFEWSELMSGNDLDELLTVRLVESPFEANSAPIPRFQTSQLPLEASMLSHGSTLAEFAQEFQWKISESMRP